ncbi:MAG: hypothetical protein KDH08_09795, partial [Anaerolineae bacterium]|nr:hypothetical protein [Anaerolineae bacterium]
SPKRFFNDVIVVSSAWVRPFELFAWAMNAVYLLLLTNCKQCKFTSFAMKKQILCQASCENGYMTRD